MKKIFCLGIILLSCSVAVIAFADNNTAAKEETTPPPAEGALSTDQIPPLVQINKNAPPPAPASPQTSMNTVEENPMEAE